MPCFIWRQPEALVKGLYRCCGNNPGQFWYHLKAVLFIFLHTPAAYHNCLENSIHAVAPEQIFVSVKEKCCFFTGFTGSKCPVGKAHLVYSRMAER